MRIRELATLIALSSAGAATASLAACSASSDTVTGTTTPAVARIVVTPVRDTIVVGQTAMLVAVALDDAGRPIGGVSFAWTSSQVRVAPVTPGSPSDTAHSTGDSVGVTQITASVGSMRSTPMDLTVVPASTSSDGSHTPGGPGTQDSVPGTTDTTKTALIACGGVNLRVHSWTGHIIESYVYSTSGTDDQGDPHSYDINESADLTVRLDLVDDDYMTAYFRGTMQGTASIHDKQTETFPDGDVNYGTDDGSGPILDPLSLGYSAGLIYLIIDKTTCHYQFYSPQAWITVTDTQADQRGSYTLQLTEDTGIAHSRYFPISGLSGASPMLSGRGPFVAGEWIDTRALNMDDPNPPDSAPFGFYWGPGNGMFDSGVATSGKAGAADISWTFTPIR
jgi:hypothetical protein